MNNFNLYSITFRSGMPREDLTSIAKNFHHLAEVDEYDENLGAVTVRLVSGCTTEQLDKLCDDYKIQIESRLGVRLIYKVTRTML